MPSPEVSPTTAVATSPTDSASSPSKYKPTDDLSQLSVMAALSSIRDEMKVACKGLEEEIDSIHRKITLLRLDMEAVEGKMARAERFAGSQPPFEQQQQLTINPVIVPAAYGGVNHNNSTSASQHFSQQYIHPNAFFSPFASFYQFQRHRMDPNGPNEEDPAKAWERWVEASSNGRPEMSNQTALALPDGNNRTAKWVESVKSDIGSEAGGMDAVGDKKTRRGLMNSGMDMAVTVAKASAGMILPGSLRRMVESALGISQLEGKGQASNDSSLMGIKSMERDGRLAEFIEYDDKSSSSTRTAKPLHNLAIDYPKPSSARHLKLPDSIICRIVFFCVQQQRSKEPPYTASSGQGKTLWAFRSISKEWKRVVATMAQENADQKARMMALFKGGPRVAPTKRLFMRLRVVENVDRTGLLVVDDSETILGLDFNTQKLSQQSARLSPQRLIDMNADNQSHIPASLPTGRSVSSSLSFSLGAFAEEGLWKSSERVTVRFAVDLWTTDGPKLGGMMDIELIFASSGSDSEEGEVKVAEVAKLRLGAKQTALPGVKIAYTLSSSKDIGREQVSRRRGAAKGYLGLAKKLLGDDEEDHLVDSCELQSVIRRTLKVKEVVVPSVAYVVGPLAW
ncbi:hypothetical protein HDU67_003775 [Dinochytrium kinnereticum]|nr:hypothetical protein HDU67_003775 [Dinochytrium kinnereticum]